MIPTSTLWTFLRPTLLPLPLLPKLCIEFPGGDTIDLDIKDIGRRRIPSRDLSNSHLLTSFYCASDFIASSDTSSGISTSPIPSLDQDVLKNNLLEGSGIAKLDPDKISFLNLSSNLWSSGSYRLCIILLYSFWYNVPCWDYFDNMHIQGLMSSS